MLTFLCHVNKSNRSINKVTIEVPWNTTPVIRIKDIGYAKLSRPSISSSATEEEQGRKPKLGNYVSFDCLRLLCIIKVFIRAYFLKEARCSIAGLKFESFSNFAALDLCVHMQWNMHVQTPMGFPTGSSQAEEFWTEQLCIDTSPGKLRFHKRNCSICHQWKKPITMKHAFLLSESSYSWFLSLTRLVSSLALLWWVCWQRTLSAHLKEVM